MSVCSCGWDGAKGGMSHLQGVAAAWAGVEVPRTHQRVHIRLQAGQVARARAIDEPALLVEQRLRMPWPICQILPFSYH